MRIIIAILSVLVTFMVTGQASAQVGMPMSYELMPRPEDGYTRENLFEVRERLVVQVEASLERDPSGNGHIIGTPCSTPNVFFRGFRELHPEHAPENLQDLPRFMRTLQLMRAQELGIQGDMYSSSRMMCHSADSSSSQDELDLEGVERAVRLNEFVWVHPNGSVMMLGDCSNIVRAPVLAPLPEAPPREIPPAPQPEECAVITYPARLGWYARQFLYDSGGADRFAPSDCWMVIDGWEHLVDDDPETSPVVSELPAPCDNCHISRYERWLRSEHDVDVGNRVTRTRYQTRGGVVQALVVPISQIRNNNIVCIGRTRRSNDIAPVTVQPSDWRTLPEYFQVNLGNSGRSVVITTGVGLTGAAFEEAAQTRQYWMGRW